MLVSQFNRIAVAQVETIRVYINNKCELTLLRISSCEIAVFTNDLYLIIDIAIIRQAFPYGCIGQRIFPPFFTA